jgi:hypothetical protein
MWVLLPFIDQYFAAVQWSLMAQSGHSRHRNILSAIGQERTLRRVIATGLGALGLLGWRRKRKAKAA